MALTQKDMMPVDERLYGFQLDGVSYIESTSGRCILGDEMGLGKTVQSLVWAGSRKGIQKILVVAPSNVIYKWKEEIKTWINRNAHIVTGYTSAIPARSRILVVSYNVMTHRWRELKRREFDLIIWDEAHYLKGNRKKTKRVAASLRLKSKYALFLSGTPFLNRPIELFNLLDMVQPEKWNLGSYGNRYCGGFDYWKGPLKGATNLSELRSKLKSVMIRRLKRDVLTDLPSLSRVILPVDIRTAEYHKALKGLNKTNAITKIMDAWHIVGREKAKVAVKWVEEFFEQAEDNVKLVIYAHHLDIITQIADVLRPFGVATITGSVKPSDRNAYIRGYQRGVRPRIIIINKAGGEGIDLFGIGDVDSSTILFVERQWTPALEWQAEGRLDRIGQKSPVVAYYLQALDTFDVAMAKRISQKEYVLDSVVGIEDIQTEIINSLL